MARIVLYALMFLAPWLFAWAALALCGLEHEHQSEAKEPLLAVTRAASQPVGTTRQRELRPVI